MTFTGIKASPEETERLRKLAEEAAKTPTICFQTGGPDAASLAWDNCLRECHKAALAAGLPEFSGYYGISQDGEFVKP